MKGIYNFKYSILSFSLLFLAFQIVNTQNLRFLDFTKDFSKEINLVFEIPISCGNGFLIQKRIVLDITNELNRRNLNVISKIDGKNVKLADTLKDDFFNIFLLNKNDKLLIATTNPDSKMYQDNLVNYPQKFINFIGYPKDDDFTKKFNLVKVLQQRIIDNL